MITFANEHVGADRCDPALWHCASSALPNYDQGEFIIVTNVARLPVRDGGLELRRDLFIDFENISTVPRFIADMRVMTASQVVAKAAYDLSSMGYSLEHMANIAGIEDKTGGWVYDRQLSPTEAFDVSVRYIESCNDHAVLMLQQH